ncbi:CDP-glucose 4,6-dehydratase [Brevibacillus migulae]|uniref:CDP-glucose 4,6-dehydratase n=1 Tax=Brevibacillus migulae TaxID=1644114 RepID=UPI00196B58B4|nr:CDP-glucose 4,6-dehydratase [Brevibacillus migulae]
MEGMDMSLEVFDFYRGKKVFITGHTGFKGSWLCRLLLNAGATVTGYSLEPESEGLFNLLQLTEEVESYTGDIQNLDFLCDTVSKVRPDIVFHLAAQPLVLQSYLDPVETFRTNIMGTVHILEAVRRCETIRSTVNVTTDKVYENKEWHWAYRENENLCGVDPYSNSKSCSELVTFSYRNSYFHSSDNRALSTARSGNVIGGGDFAADRIIPDCFRAASKGKAIIVRSPHSVRPYQHVLDCLDGYLLLAKKQYEEKVRFEGSYNFGPSDENCLTTGELVDQFCHYWGDHLTWFTQSDSVHHEATYLKIDSSKARAILNWKQKWAITEAVEKTVDWYKYFLNEGNNIVTYTDAQIWEYYGSVNKNVR